MDIKCLFESMKLTKNSDVTAHVTEMEAHLHLMQERVDELTTIGDPINMRMYFQTTLKSVPESYHTTVQTIDTADNLNGGKTTAEEIIMIFLHKACHCIILKTESKAGEALAAYKKLKGGDKRKRGRKTNVLIATNLNTKQLIAIDLEVEKRDNVLIKRVKRAERNHPTLQMLQISQ